MSALFLETLSAYIELAWRSYAERRYRPAFHAALFLLVFLPLFALVQAIHWLGYLLDGILFRTWSLT